MNNNDLVEIVRHNCLSNFGFQDERIFEVMRQVDRMDFLPDEEFPGGYSVDARFAQEKLQALRAVLLAEEKLIASMFLRLFNQAIEEASKSPDRLLYDAEFHNNITRVGEVTSDKVRRLVNEITSASRPAHYRELAYIDMSLPIRHQQTTSQPSLIAHMSKLLELELCQKNLEIGSGLGYHMAITARLIGEYGVLYSVEIINELANLAERNLEKHFGQGQRRVRVIHHDGKRGLPEEAPFNRIYITAAVDQADFDISVLASQLDPKDGILLYPTKTVEANDPFSGSLIKQRYKNRTPFGPPEIYQSVGFVPLV